MHTIPHGERPVLGWILLCWLVFSRHAEAVPQRAEWFNEGKIPSIRIEVGEEAATVLRAYRWEWGGNEAARSNVLVTVYEGTTRYTNVALHLKGSAGSFRPFDDRPALTLNFGKNGSPQRFHGLEKLHLNNSIQDGSYISEVLARQLFQEAGIPTPRAAHCQVFLNDRNLGLYVLVEGWTKQFLKRHFPDAKGTLYDGGFAHDIDRELIVNLGEAQPGQPDIRSLHAAAQIPDAAERLRQLGQRMDLDRFYRLAALEVLLAHWDGYCIGRNNYRIYENQARKQLVFLPHGLDQLFGVYRSTPEYSITPNFKSIVARAVIGTPVGRSNYLHQLGTLYTNLFGGGKVLAQVDAIAQELEAVFEPNSRRSQIWKNAVANLKDRIQRRTVSVADQLANPRQPLKFDPAGVAHLKSWGFKSDSTGQTVGERSVEDGVYLLKLTNPEIRPRTWGSWRHTELVDGGRYEFRARVKILSNPASGEGELLGMVIRMSGDRDGFPAAVSQSWQELSYSFEVAGPTEIEFLCELRGPGMVGVVDAKSLRLVKLPVEPVRAR